MKTRQTTGVRGMSPGSARRRRRANVEKPTPFGFDRFADGKSRVVSAGFKDLPDARKAVRKLEAHGYPCNELSVVMSDDTRKHHLRTHPEFEGFDPDAYLVDRVELEVDRKTLKGVGTGSAIGGALGAISAALAAAGATVVVPPLVIAGPLAAAFAGAGAGGAVGGLVGGLTGAGMSEYRAKRLERVVNKGHVIVMATARSLPERLQIEATMRDAGGVLFEDAQA